MALGACRRAGCRVLTLGSLFSGIGGLELGVEAATGARVLWQVERDAWCREVLAKHWPDAVRYDDVCTAGPGLAAVDIICGGFPCQPASVAGDRKGMLDVRWLWPEFARIVGMVRPRFVLLENVAGLLSLDGGRAWGAVLGDLAALGFDAEWDVFSGDHVGAPQERARLFCLATVADPAGAGLQGALRRESGSAPRRARGAQPLRHEPAVGVDADGVPGRLAGTRWPARRGEPPYSWEPPQIEGRFPDHSERLKALGNAVIPDVAALAWRVLSARALAGAA